MPRKRHVRPSVLKKQKRNAAMANSANAIANWDKPNTRDLVSEERPIKYMHSMAKQFALADEAIAWHRKEYRRAV